MAQEEVTRQAPRYEDVLGSPETQPSANTSSNVLPGRSAEDVAKELGISIGASRANYKTVASQEDPFAATGLEDTYQFEDKVFEQSALADFGAGLFNGLVIDTGEGIANLIPTVAQALGSEAEFLDAWSTNVSEFFENQRAVYSDEAYNTIDEFGDINASNVATALGQGVGFLTAIIAGGGIAGRISKGAKVLSRVGKTAEGLAAAAETAKASGDVGRTIKAIEAANSFAGKTKNIIAAAQKGQQQASRVGTFLAGTTLMYPSIHKEAIEAGLDKGAAARFALGVSGLVSLTEGAALEWIGKIATKPLTSVIASQASKKVLKNAANGDPIALMKMFVPEYTSALKGKMGVIMEGAAVEFGQESGQTYIEEGAKQLYDTVYKGQDKGYFGSDVTTKKTFVEAIYGGAIGAVLGGVMAGGQRPDSLGNELSQEGMFGYINNAVSQNKKGNIDKVKQAITDLVVNGKMTKTEGERATKVVDDLTAFATKVRPTNIKDNVAKYQLYQLDALGNSTTAIQESFEEKANDKNPKIAADYKKKQGMISSVQQALQAEFDSIYDTGQKQTGNKVAFETKLDMYKSLMNDVAKSGVTEDEFKIRMEAITSLNDSVHAAKGSKENTVSVDGVDFPVDVVDANMDKLLDLSDQLERGKLTTEQFEKELKDKYGLSPDQAKVVAQFEFKQKYDLLKAQAAKTQAAQAAANPAAKTSGQSTQTVDIESGLRGIMDTPENYNSWSNLRDGSDKSSFTNAIDLVISQFKNAKVKLTKENILSSLETHKVAVNQKIKNAIVDFLLNNQQATQTGNKTSTTTSIQKKINDTISKIFGSEALFDFNENQPGKVVRGQFIPDNLGDQMFEAMNKTLKGEVVPTDQKEAARLFKEYAKVVHPDKNTQSDEHQVIAEAFFKAMQTAKDKGRVDILNELKNKFDAELAALEATQSTQTGSSGVGGDVDNVTVSTKDKNFNKEEFVRDIDKLEKEKKNGSKNIGLYSFKDKFVKVVKSKRKLSKENLNILRDRVSDIDNVYPALEIIDLPNGSQAIVMDKATGKIGNELTQKEIDNIPQEHWDKFEQTIRELSKRGVQTDLTKRSNVLYDKDKGFQFIDLEGASIEGDSTNKFFKEDGKEYYYSFEKYTFFPKEYKSAKEIFTDIKQADIEKKQGKVKMKVYRTEGTGMGKLSQAHRGSGKYYGLDKFFSTGKKGETFSEVELEIDEDTTLDLTESQKTGKETKASVKYKEITDEARKRLEALPKNEVTTDTYNDLVRDVALEKGVTGVISYIEPGAPDIATMMNIGREYVDYSKPAESKETNGATTEQSLENLTTDELKAKSQEIKDEIKKVGNTANINDVSRMIDQYKAIDDVLAKRDSKLDEMISVVQEEKTKQGLSVDMAEDVFSDMTDSQVETMEAFVEGKEIDPLKAQYLSDYLYSKYKELIALRNNPKRQYTVEQINAFREQLEIDLHDLAVITEGESSFLQSTRVKPADYGKAKKKTNAQKKGEQREETRLRKRLKRQEAARLKKENEVIPSEEIKESEQEIESTALETTIETTQEIATPAIDQVEKKKKRQVEKKRVKPDSNKSYGIEWSVGRSSAKWDKESQSYTFFDSEGYLVQSIGAIKKLAKKLSQKPGMINSWFNDFLDDNEKQFVKNFLNEFYQTILAVENNVLQPREAVLLRALKGTKFKDKNGALAKDLTDVNKKKWMSKAGESGFDIDTFATEMLLPLLLEEGYGQSEEDVLIEEIKDVISRYPKGITNADIKEAAINIDAERLYQMEQEFTEMYGLDLSIVTETLNTITNEKDSSLFEESEISEDENGTEEYSEEEVESSSLDEVSKELDGYEDDGGIGLPNNVQNIKGKLDGSKLSEIAGKLEANKDRLIELLGSSMYAEKLKDVVYKELLQNAFDAVKISIAKGLIGKGKIDIEINEKERIISFTDNGIGMTSEIVQKAFFTIGGTYKGDDVDNKLKSGGLGLAKMAFIFGSERLILETVHNGIKTTVNATSQEIRNDNFKIKSEQTNEKNGTKVSVKIPETYVDSKGEKRNIDFPLSIESEFEYSFLENPLLGNVDINYSITNRNFWYRKEEIIQTNLGKIPKGFILFSAAKTGFADMDIYIDTRNVTRGRFGDTKHKILSSGLFQFDFSFTTKEREKIPLNIIIDIKPTVNATDGQYPFNNQRENFKPTVINDIKALNAYLQLLWTSIEVDLLKSSFNKIKNIDAVDVNNIDNDIIEANKNITKQFASSSNSEIIVKAVEDFNKRNKEAFIEDGGLRTEELLLTKEDIDTEAEKAYSQTFKADKNISIDKDLSVKLDSNKPIIHNNTTMNIDAESTKFLSEVSSIMIEYKKSIIDFYGENYSPNIKDQLWGVSIDKEYGGVNVNPSFINMLAINPFYNFPTNPQVDAVNYIAVALDHLIIHELNHNFQRNEGAGFTGRFITTYSEIHSLPNYFELISKLKLTIKNNLQTIKKLNYEYQQSENVESGFEGNRLEDNNQKRSDNGIKSISKNDSERNDRTTNNDTRSSEKFGEIINSNIKPELQKKRFAEVSAANETIKANPTLFNNIRNFFKAAFPNVSVEIVDSMMEKYGFDALASAYNNMINIQKDTALQSSIIHEYAEIYVASLGLDHPLVKMGMELVKGTEMHKRAIEAYPELSAEGQLKEALMETIALKGLAQLKTKFEGTTTEKIMAWLKRFWNRIAGMFNSKKYNELDKLTKGLLNNRTTYKTSSLSGVRFQKNYSSTKAAAGMYIQNTISKIRLAAIKNPDIDVNNPVLLRREIYEVLLQRYYTEKDPEKTTSDKIFENINLKEDADIADFFNAIQEKNEWLKNFINESIKSVTRVSKVTDRDLAENEGIIKADSSNAIKANKGFSPSVRSVISSIVDNEGKAMPINEVYRYVASVATSSLNAEDFFRRIKQKTIDHPDNLIYDRVYNLLKHVGKEDRQMLLYEMSNVRQNVSKKFGLSKEIDRITGIIKNKSYVKQLNKDYETSTTTGNYLNNIKNFNDIEALENIFEEEMGWYQNFSVQAVTQSNSEFAKRLSAVKITERTRTQYNQLLSVLIGNEVPKEYTDNLIDSGIDNAQKVLYRIATNTQGYKFGKGALQEPLDINSTLSKIAQAVEGTEGLLNSYVNSNGENVTSTSVTHWMDDLARMYQAADPKRLEEAQMELMALEKSGTLAKEDIADLKKLIKQLKKAIKYKNNYKKSELYKNNTILNLADRNQGKINYFNADAIDNDGKVRELGEQSKNDIVITQLIAFANDPSKSTYSQQYGVQGDRPRTIFFEAPRLRGVALEQAYNDIINADQFLYNQYKKEVEKKFKDKESIDKSLERYRNIYNKSGLTKIDAEGKVSLPSQEDINKRVKAIKRIVEASGLGEVAIRDEEGELTGEVIPSVLAADHVYGENAIYKTEDEMYENFVRNESINRTHLNNLFQGPAVQRKSIEDHIKRALGTNSTAMLTNIDKPVVTVVIKAKSKVVFDKKGNPINTSDSMSINGSRLHTHLAKEVGGFERLGSNIKDLLFQINPLTGKMAFLKMSTIGIVGKPGDNNLTRMTNAENTTGRTGYAEIAEVAFQLEELIGDKKYLKIVDEKAIKGNEGADVVALDVDELMAIQKEEDPAKKAALLQSIIDNNSFELEYDGYRIPFKMHKDLSKVALKDQKAVVSTQATKIALNTGHASDVIKLEKAIVKLLKKNLGLKKGDGYKTSSIYKKFKQTANIINGVLAGSEDSGKESVVHLLDGIKQYNDSLDAETKEMKVSLTALKENNKDVTKRSAEVVKEITSLESKINAIESKKITALDHPNLKGMVEQYIGSAMTTTAARAEMAGNYLHMVPNYSNDLKAPTKISVKMSENQLTRFKSKIKKNEEKLERLKSNPNSLEENIKKQENYLSKLKAEYASGVKETLTDFEVAVPWSMFGSSLEEAQAFLNKRKAEGKPVKVVVVRVPASDAVSTFAADVAYLIDGESNMAIVPDQFVKMSDADHDGDKVFVYREELDSDKDGKTIEVESAASELFWNMYNQISSDEIRERHDNDLSTTEIEEILDKHGLRNAEGYSLEGHDDVAEVLSKYSFGAKAIGIEAVAGKLLSMFTQSNVSLKNSITYKGVQYKAFVPDNQIAVAKILQAALDMGNDPILLETGINKYTIGAANAMLYLGVSLEDTILMMRDPAIQNFINEVDADKSVFSKYSGKFEDTLSREADKLAGITRTDLTMSAARVWSKGAGLQVKGKDFFKVGQIYATKDKEVGYFRVGKDAETGKLIIVDENVGPLNSPAVNLIRSFLEFHEAAEEIKGIIPVVQMDNSMPKNSEELRKALESFEKLRSGRTIDFTPLLERPLLQHYESVLDLMVDLEQTHFATEKGSYGTEGKNNMINEIERAFKKDYSNRNKIVDTFTRMVAQGESPVSEPAKFEKTFVSRLTNILEYIKEGALVHADKDYNELLSYHNSGNIEEYNKLIQWMENGLNEVDKNKLRNNIKEWISFNDSILNSIKDPNNMFINAITIQTNKQGVSSVVPKKGYRLQGEHIKEQIRQDFLKIMDTPLGQDFISYQMLKNGVSDKIGSLIDMMPREISVNYLKKMSKIKDSGKVSKVNIATAIAEKIYSELGTETESENVILPKDVDIEADGSGLIYTSAIEFWRNIVPAAMQLYNKKTPLIVAFRGNSQKTFLENYKSGTNTIGNPFDWKNESGNRKEQGVESTKKFIKWMITGDTQGNNNATEEYRQAIIKDIKSGKFKNSSILYYESKGYPTHATALDYLINKHNWDLTNDEMMDLFGIENVKTVSAQPNFRQSYKLNALMYNKSDLPKAMISNYGTWLNQGWSRDKNDNVIYAHKGASSTIGVEQIRAPMYYNENKITKFDPNATLTKENYEELKKQCKKPM